LGNLSTPKSVQKLQTALHAKAKAEAGYRFYALYDKVSREDILAHAYAQCRSNKAASISTNAVTTGISASVCIKCLKRNAQRYTKKAARWGGP
jgi:hypothetical protein